MTALQPETVSFLESGCALIVGTLRPDGTPHAQRAWGLDVLTDAPDGTAPPLDAVAVVRLLVADDDPHPPVPASPIAITGTHVLTFRSLQLKGDVLDVVPAGERDRARAERYTAAFYDDVVHSDNTPRHLLERLTPDAFRTALVAVRELYDQTPGPDAGARVELR